MAGQRRKQIQDTANQETKQTENQEAGPPQDDLQAAAQEGRARRDPRQDAKKARDGGRIPLGSMHQKLVLEDFSDQLEGYVPRWIKDTKSRIRDALRAGYEPIYRDGIKAGSGEDLNTDMGTWVSQVTGTDEGGRPEICYAMKIKKEWYKQDQANKQKQVDSIDEAIRGEGVNSQQNDGRYVKQNTYQVGSKI